MEIAQSKNNTPQLSLIINAPIDAVWDALRSKEKLLQWHGWDTPSLEEEIESIYFADIKEDGSDSRKRTLVVNGGDTFMVEAKEAMTKLTLIRAGLSGDPEWDAYYDNITEGWVSFVEQLRFMLEHNPKGSRKTIFSNLSLERNDVLEQLNLADEKIGTHFEGQFQDNDITGSVWFSTPNQLGLVVDVWGPGLLILQFSEKGCIITRYS